mmetsp:Transcript_43054/g.67323  ORF Transcript_43054/g.67323 Transcript_43054/m.67323 type:complete len:106 (-) Transcript_43054:270-587(-)
MQGQDTANLWEAGMEIKIQQRCGIDLCWENGCRFTKKKRHQMVKRHKLIMIKKTQKMEINNRRKKCCAPSMNLMKNKFGASTTFQPFLRRARYSSTHLYALTLTF